MAPFRMPFTTRKGPISSGLEPNDENARPEVNGGDSGSSQRTGKDSIAFGSKSARDEPNEYKMSLVNDSGIYLPPSPTEKKSFWHRTPTSTTSSNHRSVFSENEPFSISRESFESYRRSFDISGRSPVLQADSFPSRTSLDSRALPRLPRSSVTGSTFERPRPEPTEEEKEEAERFEDVGLQDEPTKPQKKKSFFSSRFGESNTADTTGATSDTTATNKSHFGLHLPGRRRGHSGQGAELGNIERPSSKGRAEGVVR